MQCLSLDLWGNSAVCSCSTVATLETCAAVIRPEAVLVVEVRSVRNGIGFEEHHTHYGKDVGHGKQKNGDEHH